MPIEQFLRHVSTLHENTDLGFYNEFEVRKLMIIGVQIMVLTLLMSYFQSISYSAMSKNITWTHSLNPINKPKNRYDNVVACKYTISHSRTLSWLVYI